MAVALPWVEVPLLVPVLVPLLVPLLLPVFSPVLFPVLFPPSRAKLAHVIRVTFAK